MLAAFQVVNWLKWRVRLSFCRISGQCNRGTSSNTFSTNNSKSRRGTSGKGLLNNSVRCCALLHCACVDEPGSLKASPTPTPRTRMFYSTEKSGMQVFPCVVFLQHMYQTACNFPAMWKLSPQSLFAKDPTPGGKATAALSEDCRLQPDPKLLVASLW